MRVDDATISAVGDVSVLGETLLRCPDDRSYSWPPGRYPTDERGSICGMGPGRDRFDSKGPFTATV